jgi:hypothetical protein
LTTSRPPTGAREGQGAIVAVLARRLPVIAHWPTHVVLLSAARRFVAESRARFVEIDLS